MMKISPAGQKHREYIANVKTAATLIDGPRTLEEVADRSSAYLRPLGLFQWTERRVANRVESVRERLDGLIRLGWISAEGGRYALTPQGCREVQERLSQLGGTGARIRAFLQPQTVSRITLAVHWGLAAVKLPAGLLSGSVALLNDGIDTLTDGIASLLVFFGIRFRKERPVNVLLVALMLVTGLLTLYEAVRRFFVFSDEAVSGFAFLAVILSAAFCLALWIYQRYVGLHSGLMVLITQSVDSRNHIVVALSVAAGLIASRLRFNLLDTLVGLGVALLILQSALELAVETVRSLGEEETNLSRFEFGFAAQYDRFRGSQLRDWMLYLVDRRGIQTRAELAARAREALDFGSVPAARAMGLIRGRDGDDALVEESLADLFRHGWLVGDKRLRVTDTGRKRLNGWTAGSLPGIPSTEKTDRTGAEAGARTVADGAGRAKNRATGIRRIASGLVEVGILISLPVLFHFLIPVKIIVRWPYSLLGVIPMILGLALLAWAGLLFHRAGAGFALRAGASEIVSRGPFRFSRNPMYLGMLIWLAGLSILLGSLMAFLFPVLFFLLANFLVIPIEEKNMERTAGKPYIEYRRRVRRWL
jgi:protein-S-isoprenylcysteine O-methyltransferase Ste14